MPIHNSDSESKKSMETEVRFSEAELAATLPNTESEAQNISMTKLAKAVQMIYGAVRWICELARDILIVTQEISKLMRARFPIMIIGLVPPFLLAPGLFNIPQNNPEFALNLALTAYIVNVVLSGFLLGILGLSMANFFVPNLVHQIPDLIKNVINTIDRILLSVSIGVLGGILGTGILSTYLFYNNYEKLKLSIENAPEIIQCVTAMNQTITAQVIPAAAHDGGTFSLPAHFPWFIGTMSIGSLFGIRTGTEAWKNYSELLPLSGISSEQKDASFLSCFGLYRRNKLSTQTEVLTEALESGATADRAEFPEMRVTHA